MSAVNHEFLTLRRDLIGRLDSFRAHLRRHLAIEGFARWLSHAILLLLLSFVLDRLLRLSVPTRITLVLLGAGYLAYEAIRRIVMPANLEMTPVELAAAIDRSTTDRPEGTRPVLAARVASILELPALLEGHAAPSPSMVRTAVVRCHDALDAVDFDDHLNPDRRRLARWAIAALVVLPAILVAISPATAGLWFRRFFLASHQPWPQKTYLNVQGVDDGRLIVPRAEPFALRVLTREGSVEPRALSLRYREGNGSTTLVAMSRFAPGDWRYDLPPLSGDAAVTVSGNDDVEDFIVSPVERPRITDLVLTAQHPTEPHPTAHRFGGLYADWSFLAKTKLSLTFASNVPVAEARLKGIADVPSLADLRRVDDRTFSIAWIHQTPVQLQIELIGQGARLASVPVPISIGLKQDLPPRVSLTFTGVRQHISPTATIPLAIQARDDYGIARLDLTTHAQSLTDNPTTAPTTRSADPAITRTLVGPVIPPTDLEIQHADKLSIASLKLPPGSILTVVATAVDNCYLGPQSGSSRQLTFRVVPADELFREILQRQQVERVKFRKQLDAARKLAEQIPSIQTPQAAADAARDHRAIQHEVLRISNTLGQGVTEMKLNDLGGRDAWDLMNNKVLGPLKKLNDVAMNQQKDALDTLQLGDASARTAAAARQQQIVIAMQEALKQMSQWDSFVDVLNQLNEIIKLENNVHQSTNDLRKKQTEGVFE